MRSDSSAPSRVSAPSPSAIMPESEGLEKYVVNDLFDEMLDTIVQGLCFEVHRAHKNGRLFLDEGPQVSEACLKEEKLCRVAIKETIDRKHMAQTFDFSVEHSLFYV